MMNNGKQHKALEALKGAISYDLYNEIESVIFSGENNADDTGAEQGFLFNTSEWYAIYTATVESMLDAGQYSNECLDFFKNN